MLIRSQDKETLIDATRKRLTISGIGSRWSIEVRELVSDSNRLIVTLGCYPTKEKAIQVLNDIEMPGQNGDMTLLLTICRIEVA